MAQPVWVLSVDLQTKTATFQTGMAEAARSARGAFGEIRSGAGEMAVGVHKGSIDVRHSLGLVDNVIRGAHSQAMADLVRMYAQSALVMNTLPIAAAAAGLALIGGIAFEAAEHVHKLKEEAAKLKDDFTNLDTAGNNAFRQLDDALLKSEQHADELRNDHLAALKVQLELIDHQSMGELVKSFGEIEKAADEVFKALQSHWYTFGSGSAGASHALNEFKTQYENLLSMGKDKEASDLLHGTLQSAKEVLQLQKEVQDNNTGTGLLGPDLKDPEAYYSAQNRLRQMGIGYTKTEVESQQALVQALEQQAGIESRVNELKKQDSGNAKTEYGQGVASRAAAAAKAAAEAQLTMGQSALSGEKAQADAQLTIHNATLEERLESDLAFAARKHAMETAANAAEIAALDKSGKDYANQLKALHEKALEIDQQYETQKEELTSRAAVAISQRNIQVLESGIRQQISATENGTAARLAAIDAGIREEEARHLQESSFYRELQNQRVQAYRQMLSEQSRATQEAAAEDARHESVMGRFRIASQKQADDLYNSGHHGSRARIVQQKQALADEEYRIQMAAVDKQIQGLDKGGKDYENKLRTLQDREVELTRAHEMELTAITSEATEARNEAVKRSYQNLTDSISHDLTASIMRHQTWAQTLASLSNQVISGLMETAIRSVMADDFTKEKDAAAAARKAFLAGMHLPFPANLIAAPTLAAGAFAAVMAYNAGTDGVPGVGRTDVVPALLTPGEGVVPGGVMDGLRSVAQRGGFQSGHTVHIQAHFAPEIHALDAEGVDRVLSKHQDVFQEHMERAVRKVNH